MPITIGNNILSLRAQRDLFQVNGSLSQTLQRLASGSRLNRPSDDAAGSAIVSDLNTRSRVYAQAIRNANDAISATAIAEGSVTQLGGVLTRLKELAQGAANGSFSRTQRISMDKEAYALTNEYNRLVQSTKFNGISLISGNLERLSVQLGYGTSELLGIALGTGLTGKVGLSTSTQTRQDFVSYASPSDGVSADFDNDGKLDFALVELSTQIRVSFGDGAGGVSGSTSNSLGVALLSDITTGDFNGDGYTDFAATAGTGAYVFINNKNRTFSAASGSPIALPSAPSAIEAFDADGDGITDLAVSYNAGVGFLRGNGNGTFAASVAYALTGSLSDLAIGDFNGDSKTDIATRTAAGQLYILNGSGTGSFALTTSLSTGVGAGELRATDFNHDGVDDLLMGGSNASYRGANVYLSNGDSTFGSVRNLGSSISGAALGFADFNNDGHVDIIEAGSTASGAVKMYYGNGDGTFQSATTMTIGSAGTASGFTLGDFNSDGVTDLLIGDQFAEAYEIRLLDTANSNTIARLDLTTARSARSALTSIDALLDKVAKELGIIGAGHSRMSSALNTLTATRENYLAASGRIANVDVAEESARLIRQQTLQQAATAVLAQANQAPSLVLNLLGI